MAFALIRRSNFLTSLANSLPSTRICKFSSSKASTSIPQDRGHSVGNRLHLSPLFPNIDKYDLNDCKIELVDDETWRVSSGLADAWRSNETLKMGSGLKQGSNDNGSISPVDSVTTEIDLDAIEDMRIHGNLFYKLDKDSKEFEECKFHFHRRKCSRNEKDRKQRKEKEEEDSNKKHTAKVEVMSKRDIRSDGIKNLISQLGDSCIAKKQRTPTFNQLTAPYHEPFCLDIHITKGSVRASIIHRATSKVVAVSHSISKDMKFDMGSCKNRKTCAAVGEVLARRALADDIHNVVYTPRKGEKLQGKLLIVLNSIINGGVVVKVKLKQKKLRKARGLQD